MGRAATGRFSFVQLEFGFQLGPADGRYLVRAAPDSEPRAVIALRTLGAPQRRLRRRRRPRAVRDAEPEAVPTSRATVIRTGPFEQAGEAETWLDGLRGDRTRLDGEVDWATRELNGLLRAQRAAASDPYVRDVDARTAHAVRVGYGSGERVADGRFEAAYEVPPARGRGRRAERLAPEERLAGILGGREPLLAADELVLRARTDLDAGRPREAALQARIALECVLEEASDDRLGQLARELERSHAVISEAAAVAVAGDPPERLQAEVAEAVRRMESGLRRYRSSAG